MMRRLALGVFLVLTVVSLIFALRDNKTVTTSSAEAYRHYLAGADLSEKVYIRQAAKEFEKAVELDSGFAVAQAYLARTYGGLGLGEKAKETWNLAMSNKPKVSEREQLLIDMWAADANSDPASLDSFTTLYITKHPRDREGYIVLANREFAKENWERSIELYQKILTIDPTYANSYNMLGYLNYYLGRYDEALTSLDKYIELCPGQANPHDSRGEILFARGEYEAALREFREAFNINPEIDFPVTHMAATYAALGEVKQMEYCFEMLASLPGTPMVKSGYLISKARLYVDCGKFDAAKEILTKIMNEDQDTAKSMSAWAVSALGLVAYVTRDSEGLKSAWKQRREYIDRAIKTKPEVAEGTGVTRTHLFMDGTEADLNGDLQTAARKFAELCDSTKNPAEKVTMRRLYADVLWRKGDIDLAKSELQKNLTANPNEPKSLTLLADIADSEQNVGAANEHRRRALAVWRNADTDFIPLAVLQDKLNAPLASSKRVSSGL